MTNQETPRTTPNAEGAPGGQAREPASNHHAGPSLATRPARRSDVSAMARVLARAFHDDPVMMWMLPDPAARARALPKMFATMARRRYLAGGGAEVIDHCGAIAASALWDGPGRWKTTRTEALLMTPALLWGFRSRITRTDTVMRETTKNHPTEPHWYLMSIGTDPSSRRCGLGDVLMRSRLERCDAERYPAYLEATKPELLQFYSRFGFEVTGEIELPNGPKLWSMWRPPKQITK